MKGFACHFLPKGPEVTYQAPITEIPTLIPEIIFTKLDLNSVGLKIHIKRIALIKKPGIKFISLKNLVSKKNDPIF